jgi:O-antigen/teichoic acid export membrane protein
MSAAKAAIESAIATAAKLAGALVAIKVMAHFLGPDGLGVVGQFMSLAAILVAATSGGVSLGVTRYVAESQASPEYLSKVMQTSSWIVLLSCTVLALLVLPFAEQLSELLFGSGEFSSTLRFSCLLFLPIGYSTIGLSAINGLSATRALALVQCGAAALGSVGLYLAIFFGREQGAALGLLWMTSCSIFFIAIWWTLRQPAPWNALLPIRDDIVAKNMSRYAIMTLVTAALQNTSQIVVRGWLQTQHGWESAGHWQAMIRISDAYLQVFNVFLVAYLLPKLSQTHDAKRAVVALKSTYYFLLPALFTVLVIGYVIRDFLIEILLTPSFVSIRELFLPQMIGDFFKISAFIPGYLVLARGYAPLLFAVDPVQVVLVLSISVVIIPNNGSVGACWAYALAYFIYALLAWIGLAVYSRRFRTSKA